MVAVYMHRVYGMPLVTLQEAKQNPAVADHLRHWSTSGYAAYLVDAQADVVWYEIEQQSEYVPKRVLIRKGAPPQAPEASVAPSSTTLSLEQRESQYAQARQRIMNEVCLVGGGQGSNAAPSMPSVNAITAEKVNVIAEMLLAAFGWSTAARALVARIRQLEGSFGDALILIDNIPADEWFGANPLFQEDTETCLLYTSPSPRDS